MSEKKKILVHCCTNWNTSNFGDVLFAEMILRHLTDAGYEAALYDPSPYICDYLFERRGLPHNVIRMADADACIYFAGGYFGEHKKDKLSHRLIHFKRFMPFGIKSMMLKKKICVIGIGAGEHLWFPSRWVVRKVCERSFTVTTRDEESTAFLKKIGVKREIVTCSDIAQTIDPKVYFGAVPEELRNVGEAVFLHTNNLVDIASVFADGLKEYFEKNRNVTAIVGNDYKMNIDKAYEAVADVLGKDRVIKYRYTYPDELCAVLASCRMVLTYKLHVGICASAFGCSVLSFYRHEKIPRYYSQIGQADRSVALDRATPECIADQIERFADKKIIVPDEVAALAQKNWQELDRFLATV